MIEVHEYKYVCTVAISFSHVYVYARPALTLKVLFTNLDELLHYLLFEQFSSSRM